MKQRRKSLISLLVESTVLVLGVVLAFWGWRQYDNIIPTVPIPEGAILRRRNPELVANHSPYHSAIARYWYYEKYSTRLPYEEVKAFYDGKSAAWPFGLFSVIVLPPATTAVTNTYDRAISEGLALPLGRDKNDRINETIILVEVSRSAGDDGPAVLIICLFPLALMVGFIIIAVRYHSAA